MRRHIGFTLAVLAVCATAHATGVNLTAHVGDGSGLSAVTVNPGCTLDYTITADTTDSLHMGLALIGFDVSFDGGDMVIAPEPISGAMTAFVVPDGITNPMGFGGTPIAPLVCSDATGNCTGLVLGDACGATGTCGLGPVELVQVGGGQNTILNGQTGCTVDTDCPGTTCTIDADCTAAGATCVQGKCSYGACVGLVCEAVASFPTGLVTTMIGMPGAPVDIVSGEVTVPAGTADGVYMLRIKNVFGNVIRAGETGIPFWAVDQIVTTGTGSGTTTNLAITVDSTASCPGPGTAPVALSWKSIGQHGPGCTFNPACGGAEYGLDIPAAPATTFSESRSTGVNKIVVTYDQDVNLNSASILVTGCNVDGTAAVTSGITMSVIAGATPDQAVMQFVPSLPGNNPQIGETPVKYEITLDGVTSLIGAVASGPETRTITAIFGDANSVPITVNNGDLGFVRSARDIILARPAGMQVVDPNSATGMFEIRADINNDNTVSNGDLGLVRVARDSITQPSGLCP